MSEEDITVALCGDCLSVIPESMAEKDPFIQQGMTGVCPFCRGPVILCNASNVERLRAKRNSGDTLI